MDETFPKITLYGYFRSSTSYRTRIVLNLKKIDYEQRTVHLVKDGGEHRLPAYRAINPQMRVPSLVVETGATRNILIQSPAIIEWIEETFPLPPLLPQDPFAKANCRAVAAIIGCDIHPINNISTLNYLKDEFARSAAEVQSWYAKWVVEGLAAIEELIDPGPYAMGKQVTLADAYLVPQLFNARRYNVPLQRFPKILAAADACASLDAFIAAAPEKQPDAV